MKHLKKLILVLCFMFITVPALAQDEQCLAVIQAAFAAAEQVCSAIGRNLACFGSANLQATPHPDLPGFTFNQPGNTLNIRELQTLHSSGFESGSYGVSFMRIQASLPDFSPEQNVSLLVFGDVQLQNVVNAADVLPTVQVTPPSQMNIRGGPSTEDSIVGLLDGGQTVAANGRIGDNSWLRITLPDGTYGWLSSSLVNPAGDINTLDVVDSSGTPVVLRYAPMQSFTLRSGVTDAPCAGAPESGILIQVPSDDETFSINGVEIHVSGTTFLQAGTELVVSALEGTTRVGASGITHVLLPGTQVRVPLDASQVASGAPLQPQPYDAAALQSLPLTNLDRDVVLSPALSPEQIAASGVPSAGEWNATYTVLRFHCADGRTVTEERNRANPLTLEVAADGSTITLIGSPDRDDPPFEPVTLARTGAGFYTGSATLENAAGRQSQYEFTVVVLSATHIEGEVVGLGGDCTTIGPFIANLATG
jgi:hypothetical protein